MKKIKLMVLGVTVLAGVAAPAAFAATSTANTTLTQKINPGTATTTTCNPATRATVTTPTYAMTDITASTNDQAATGTMGSASQAPCIDNPSAGVSGWTLALAGSTTSSTWSSSAASAAYAFNGGAGGTGVDKLTVSPGSYSGLTGPTAGITVPAGSATFQNGTVDSVTLATGDATAAKKNTFGYVSGVGLSQVVPGGTPAATDYQLPMVQTLTIN